MGYRLGHERRRKIAATPAQRTAVGRKILWSLQMLILTRRLGETLMIGTQVTVTVLAVKGSQVRLGIGAPTDVEVHREEIFEKVQREKAGTRGGS
jgi:carbon storage regulator